MSDFPSFDKWLEESIGTGLNLTREDVAQMHLRYEKERLFAEEGIMPDESKTHEGHE